MSGRGLIFGMHSGSVVKSPRNKNQQALWHQRKDCHIYGLTFAPDGPATKLSFEASQSQQEDIWAAATGKENFRPFPEGSYL